MFSKNQLVKKGFEIFTKIFMKYEILGKRSLDLGNGVRINASKVHTIEAIGKGYANSVTSLSEYFMITKGAVSQVTSQLHKDRYIKKVQGNNKVVVLELTDLGMQALQYHDEYNLTMIKKIETIEKKYSKQEIGSFVNILTDVDKIFGEYIEEA